MQRTVRRSIYRAAWGLVAIVAVPLLVLTVFLLKPVNTPPFRDAAGQPVPFVWFEEPHKFTSWMTENVLPLAKSVCDARW
jgi:hypothetical protein